MSAIALLLAQLAAPSPESTIPTDAPSIEIRAEVRADKVQIEREGEVSVRLEGHPLADKDQRSERNREKGRGSYSNLVIRTHAYVTLADPLADLLARSEAQSGGEQTDLGDEAETQQDTTKTGNDE